MNHAMSVRRFSLLAVLALLAGCLTSVVVTALAGIPAARADTVPPAPAGWTTVFGDDFAGSAGSAPSASNWFYDIGTGYGTGEIEHTTSSNQQRLPGRQRPPGAEGDQQRRDVDIRPDREHPGRLSGAARREAGDDRVDRAAEPGQRSGVLACILGARVADADGRRLAPVR